MSRETESPINALRLRELCTQHGVPNAYKLHNAMHGVPDECLLSDGTCKNLLDEATSWQSGEGHCP